MSPGAASGNRCFIPASFQSHLMNVISIRTTNFLLRRWGRPSRRPWALHKTLRAWWRKMMTSPWCRHAHRCRRVLKGSDDHRRKTERTLRTGWCTAVCCAGALVRLLGRDVSGGGGWRICVDAGTRLSSVCFDAGTCLNRWKVVQVKGGVTCRNKWWSMFVLILCIVDRGREMNMQRSRDAADLGTR